MKKFRKILFGVVGLYMFAALSLAQAQNAPEDGNGPPPGMHPGQHIQAIYSQLGLTNDQKQQLEANKEKHRGEMQRLRQEMKATREMLQQELMQTELNMPKIYQLHKQLKAFQSQMEDTRLNSILAVREILTPDQFTKFVDLMQKHKEPRK